MHFAYQSMQNQIFLFLEYIIIIYYYIKYLFI